MNLLLVLSFGGSLKKWRDVGLLSRELELYTCYLERGLVQTLYIFSYDAKDFDVLKGLPLAGGSRERIVLLSPDKPIRGTFSCLSYSLLGAFRARKRLRNVDWVKTNQISGSWAAIVVSVLSGKRLLARCGYIWSSNLYARKEWAKYVAAVGLEIVLFRLADLVSVTTAEAKHRVQHICGRTNKIFVAPTYVNTNRFAPRPDRKHGGRRVAFVGRCEPPKNVLELVRACGLAGTSLYVFGSGSLEEEMRQLANRLSVEIVFQGRIPNEHLAFHLSKFDYYVIPSIYEGLPKSLIEAMSAGLVCIGTDIPGIRDLIVDGTNGYLAAGTDAESLARAIERAMAAKDNWSIRANARRYALEQHSIDRYISHEMERMRSL